MPSKLLILHDEAKSYCFTVSWVPESFHGGLLRFDMLRIKYDSQTLANKQEQRSGRLKDIKKRLWKE